LSTTSITAREYASWSWASRAGDAGFSLEVGSASDAPEETRCSLGWAMVEYG
jgi:hypothetical protein